MNVLGHTAKQKWQSSGHFLLFLGFESLIVINPSGHAYSHAPHKTQAPTSITFFLRSKKFELFISSRIALSDISLW